MSVYVFFWYLLNRTRDSLLYSPAAYTYRLSPGPHSPSCIQSLTFWWHTLEDKSHGSEALVSSLLPGGRGFQEMLVAWHNGWMASDLSAYPAPVFAVHLSTPAAQRDPAGRHTTESGRNTSVSGKWRRGSQRALRNSFWRWEVEVGREPENQSLSAEEAQELDPQERILRMKSKSAVSSGRIKTEQRHWI